MNCEILKKHYFFQSLLEVFAPNRAEVFKNKYMMFHHGGMLFWFITSCVFVLVCCARLHCCFYM